MEFLIVLIVVFSALLHSIWNLLVKKSCDKLVFIWLRSTSMIILFLPLFLYKVNQVRDLNILWGVLVVSAFIHFLYNYFLGKTYEKGDMSLTYPIARAYPAISVIPAYFVFGETISLTSGAGIILILAGVFTINLKSLSIHEILKPLTQIRNPAIVLALITALTSAGYSITDKMGVLTTHPIIFFYLMSATQLIFLTAYIAKVKNMSQIKKEWRINKYSVITASILIFSSYLLILYVFQSNKVAFIVSLRQVSIVFGVILSSVLLKEKYGKIRLVASIIIFSGAYLIGISN